MDYGEMHARLREVHADFERGRLTIDGVTRRAGAIVAQCDDPRMREDLDSAIAEDLAEDLSEAEDEGIVPYFTDGRWEAS